MDAPIGCGTALVTPFRADGSLDEHTLYNLAQWQVESGIDWIVACGTTAETPTLTDEEWLRVIRIIAEAVAGRVPVWAGATHNSTREAAHRAALAAQIPGVTAILSANPYYNKPNQQGQFEHFRAVAQATQLPVILYNIPGRTGTNLEPATVLQLIDAAPNIAGVKESSGNLPQITELLTLVPRSFHVYAGDDNMALGVIALGGSGLVSVASNQIPGAMAEMIHAALANEWTTARRLNRKYFRLLQANFWETSPGPVKAIMTMMGKLEEHYRLPIVPVAPSTRARLERLAGELGLLVHGPQVDGDPGLF
ncbi:4-hydroxy-tetrahydrodipicolinate synthase [Silvibacterium dinghuense]|uniref:4-hydroxy-tetrahydrodipicolinate synthase n=1 Tax=Silvibacterium dinghuense TaxID=1560006 RepID=A0A4V1NVS1_9BACT|nr:4-hydroxy-tetrahydrodipicolinate synthase [Silvibacterium dinghuense]RXS96902.1 4-hydroxy-tetrahydrodipicolinate synthase [Silvibacterium dinghuense]GGG94559.1 4-hydroxy-tetrahydrodipicolinate synthase [Silvibacterium dinghuense]